MITMTLTKTDLQQIVRALDPQFDQIDKRFDQVDAQFDRVDQRFKQVDERFNTLTTDVGNMIATLATRDELSKLEDKIYDRFDEVDDRIDKLAANTAVFQSQIAVRFDRVEDKLSDHDQLFQQIFNHVSPLTTKVRDHEIRMVKLEKAT